LQELREPNPSIRHHGSYRRGNDRDHGSDCGHCIDRRGNDPDHGNDRHGNDHGTCHHGTCPCRGRHGHCNERGNHRHRTSCRCSHCNHCSRDQQPPSAHRPSGRCLRPREKPRSQKRQYDSSQVLHLLTGTVSEKQNTQIAVFVCLASERDGIRWRNYLKTGDHRFPQTRPIPCSLISADCVGFNDREV